MHITEQTVTVGDGGQVALQVSRPTGTRVRVIVLEEDHPVADAAADAAMTLTDGHEGSGFARDVLGNPAEEVWNDL